MKLFGGIIAALSSAGVISALALSSHITATITACLGFTSSITALVGEHLEKPLGGGDQKSLSEYLQQILDTEKNAKELTLKFTAGSVDILAIAKGVKEIASNIRAVLILFRCQNLKSRSERFRLDFPSVMAGSTMRHYRNGQVSLCERNVTHPIRMSQEAGTSRLRRRPSLQVRFPAQSRRQGRGPLRPLYVDFGRPMLATRVRHRLNRSSRSGSDP